MKAALRRQRTQAVALLIILGASALDAVVVPAGATQVREALLALTAAGMIAAAIWG